MTTAQTAARHGLPATTKGQATRARIIEAAANLVLEGGVAHTSLDDVGAAARVGKSQIYHYFSDKSALVGEVVARQTETILGAPVLSQLDTWESWQRWRDELVLDQQRGSCAGGCPIGSIANELADVDEASRILLVDSFDRWERTFREGIMRMQAAGLISHGAAVHSLAAAVLASLQGGLLLCKTRKSTAPLEAALDGAISLLRMSAV